MVRYQLALFQQGVNAPFWASAIQQSPVGSYATGDMVQFNGRWFLIEKVGHTIALPGPDVTIATSLVVGAPNNAHAFAEKNMPEGGWISSG